MHDGGLISQVVIRQNIHVLNQMYKTLQRTCLSAPSKCYYIGIKCSIGYYISIENMY